MRVLRLEQSFGGSKRTNLRTKELTFRRICLSLDGWNGQFTSSPWSLGRRSRRRFAVRIKSRLHNFLSNRTRDLSTADCPRPLTARESVISEWVGITPLALFQLTLSVPQRNGYFYHRRNSHRSRSGCRLSSGQADWLGAIGAFEGFGREITKQGRTARSEPRRGSQVGRGDGQGSCRTYSRANASNGLDGSSWRRSVLISLRNVIGGAWSIAGRNRRFSGADRVDLPTCSANIRFRLESIRKACALRDDVGDMLAIIRNQIYGRRSDTDIPQ